jgi:hypothetical protein
MSTLAATNLKNPSSGTDNIVLNTDGTTTIASPKNIIKSATAVASTSGTAIDFTGIPSWVKRVTVMFNGVSTSGSSSYLVQIGAGSLVSTGYASYASYTSAGSVSSSSATTGLHVHAPGANSAFFGPLIIFLATGNAWISSHTIGNAAGSAIHYGGGGVTLSGTLDRVRITTVNGTDTFDAGSINIMYEG